MQQRKSNCDLCGSAENKKLYRFNDFIIQQCAECGLVSRNIFLSEEETANLYNEGYFTIEQQDYFFNHSKLKEAIFSKYLQELEKIVQTKGTLLDVGCAIGTFLSLARSSGWTVKGVEVSEFASGYARKQYELDVFTGELEKCPFELNSFDVITLWDVIDHVEKPQSFLERAYSLLKPGGIIVVATTMEDSLLYRIAHYLYKFSGGIIKHPASRCHPLHHSTYYSRKTMRKSLLKVGLEIIKEQPGDLNSELINTNYFTRLVLKCLSFAAFILDRPMETIFYARKVK